MDKYKRCSIEAAKQLTVVFALGMLLAGCGGGSSSSGASTTPVASYLADQQSGGFVGQWRALTGATLSVADANISTLATTATANTYTYSDVSMLLTSGVWGTNPNTWAIYALSPTGWVPFPNTGTLVDNGNGSDVTVTYAGIGDGVFTIANTDLAATPIVCTSATTGATVACAVPGNYPAGARSYQISSTNTTDAYFMFGGLSAAPWLPATDVAGVALTALPSVGATFCDANYRMVFQAISPAPAAGANNYNVFYALRCASADITTAIAGTSAGTVLVSNQVTGNAAVPNVLRVQAATGNPLVWMNNVIYALRAGNVGFGFVDPAGTVDYSESHNKTAINAQLLANGLVALP
ncbi:MAG TPA: hypothetical protein VGD24_02415 [Gallionella sp.]